MEERFAVPQLVFMYKILAQEQLPDNILQLGRVQLPQWVCAIVAV